MYVVKKSRFTRFTAVAPSFSTSERVLVLHIACGGGFGAHHTNATPEVALALTLGLAALGVKALAVALAILAVVAALGAALAGALVMTLTVALGVLAQTRLWKRHWQRHWQHWRRHSQC